MAFVSWDDEITKTKNRLSELSNDLSTMMTSQYSTASRSATKRQIRELQDYLLFCRQQNAMETAGDPSTRVSYGRHRRFR